MLTLTHLQTEEYRFYRLYSIDLDGARQSARLLRRYKRSDVRFSILRDVIVTYSRPFSVNRGKFMKTHSLKQKIVPAAMRPLHRELVGLRNKAFAHTDHSFRDPQLMEIPRRSGPLRFGMGFANPPYESLSRRAGEIEALVTAVEAAVNAWVDAFHARIEPLFPPQS